MIELIKDIGDNRRCSLTAWKAEEWQALSMASGLPQPSRTQDYIRAGKMIGQSHYFLIEELPRLLSWLEVTGRAYRFKNFDEVTAPSAEMLKSRAIRQQQAEKAADIITQRAALKVLETLEPELTIDELE